MYVFHAKSSESWALQVDGQLGSFAIVNNINIATWVSGRIYKGWSIEQLINICTKHMSKMLMSLTKY